MLNLGLVYGHDLILTHAPTGTWRQGKDRLIAVRQRKDGRWIVYYRDPEGKKGVVNEYFGRGPEGKLKAIQRDSELGLKTRRPSTTGPKGSTFFDLSVLYMKYRGFKPRPLE